MEQKSRKNPNGLQPKDATLAHVPPLARRKHQNAIPNARDREVQTDVAIAPGAETISDVIEVVRETANVTINLVTDRRTGNASDHVRETAYAIGDRHAKDQQKGREEFIKDLGHVTDIVGIGRVIGHMKGHEVSVIGPATGNATIANLMEEGTVAHRMRR